MQVQILKHLLKPNDTYFCQHLQFQMKRYHFAAQITENILTVRIVTEIEDTYPAIFLLHGGSNLLLNYTDVDQEKFN